MTMKWTAAPQAIIDAFGAALPDDGLVQRKKMFGYPAAFVNGNMFGGVWQDLIVLRLGESKRAEMIAAGGSEFAPMGRRMREYVVAAAGIIEDTETLGAWLEEAFRFGAGLPVKEAKPRAVKKPRP